MVASEIEAAPLRDCGGDGARVLRFECFADLGDGRAVLRTEDRQVRLHLVAEEV
jgi:hypothetical protein